MDELKFKCNNCGKNHTLQKEEVDLQFEITGGSERKMGVENMYEAEESFVCDCDNQIDVTFQIWEYPVGTHNTDEVRIENAELIEKFDFTMDFHGGADPDPDPEMDVHDCHECDGKDGMGNYVDFGVDKIGLINQYDKTHANHKFNSVQASRCSFCNELHIKCAKCDSVIALPHHQTNENVECDGGCGLIYYLDSTDDPEQLGEPDIKLIDSRIEKCANCGDDFINKKNTELCDDCEKKDNDK